MARNNKAHDSKTCATCKQLWDAAKWCSMSRMALGTHLAKFSK